jgi:hypothetical protein
MFQQHSCALFCGGLCGESLSVSGLCSLMQMLAGSGACRTVLLPVPAAVAQAWLLLSSSLANGFCHFYLQLSAMDVSVRTTMKGAAKCDKHCELQNSVNRQGLERILCFWDIPESMPASVSMLCCSSSTAICSAAVSACASRCAIGAPEASS